MKRALALVELIIVACIIGILAALVVPTMSNRAMEAKVATARDHLRILRSAIKLYAARHTGVAPGYENNDRGGALSSDYFVDQTTVQDRYMRKIPANPFNDLNTILMLTNAASFPDQASGDTGWIYKAATETIRLNWPGVDDKGIRYYDY